MAEQAERAFVTSFLSTLSTQPVTYADDYQQLPENSLKRVPVLPVCGTSFPVCHAGKSMRLG
jgi:ubiquitin-like protein 4